MLKFSSQRGKRFGMRFALLLTGLSFISAWLIIRASAKLMLHAGEQLNSHVLQES